VSAPLHGAALSRRGMIGIGLAAMAGRALAAASSPADRERALAAIPQRLQAFVDAGTIPGAVSLVQQHGRLLRLDAVGWRDVASRAPMHGDTVFQIMSQSKPYIATSVMLLHEQGLLDVDAPVERYLPEFGDMWLVEQGDGARRVLRRPAQKITLAHLLSHSSGLPDAAPVTAPFAEKMRHSLAEVTAVLSQQPLEAEPGSRWRYSNQGIAAAARAVEVVSGLDYRDFVHRRIFAALGLREATFTPPPALWPRLASVYDLKDGRLVEMGPGTPGYGDLKLRRGVRYAMPEAGIFATAQETARIHQLFLDGGQWRGQRLLARETVARMLTPRIAMGRFGGGQSWQGLGWRLEPAPPKGPGGLPAGSFHHSGALGSFGWADPASGIVGVLLLQRPNASAERDALIEIVHPTAHSSTENAG